MDLAENSESVSVKIQVAKDLLDRISFSPVDRRRDPNSTLPCKTESRNDSSGRC